MVRITLDKPYIPIPAPVAEGLELTFDDIANVPVADASSVSDWNTFFDLPTNGIPFTSVVVDGNKVTLIGGADITTKYGLFDFDSAGIGLVSVVDQTNCITVLGGDTFGGNEDLGCPLLEYVILNGVVNFLSYGGDFLNCRSLKTIELKNATSIPSITFMVTSGSASYESINIQSCISLGLNVFDNAVYDGITGQTITLTIPSALITCNGGNPDGDIQYLQANNTVTIVTV